tara:strand:- start:530 stop:1870 length:1341 start_codon:yes stop_codon:yes gene_type:complete
MRSLKNFFIIFFFIFLNNCSFDNKTGIWKEHNKKVIAEAKEQVEIERIFEKKEIFDKEIESNDLVIISKKNTNINWTQDNLSDSNFVPHLSYKNNKNKIFKSKKIGKSKYSNTNVRLEPLFLDNSIFFYDLVGNIYNYSIVNNKLIWKFNFYKKRFKNIPVIINFKIISNSLVVSDNLGYLYNLDKDTGRLIWAKNQGVPLTSELKSYNNKIFLLNQDNKFYIFEKDTGKKILDFETFPVILKKDNRQTLALDSQDNLYFVTSAGQIFSINHNNYKINWLKNIKDAGMNDEYGLFSSSPIIVKEESLYLSSSRSTVSIESSSGKTNWEIPFGTKIRPIISNRFIFLVSKNGLIINVEKSTGKIVWSKKIFTSKDISLDKIGEIHSLLLISDQLFLTTKKGYFFFVNFKNGQVINYAKVAKGFFSMPIVANEKIYIIDKKMSLLIFN